jgi:hypothetical protein
MSARFSFTRTRARQKRKPAEINTALC